MRVILFLLFLCTQNIFTKTNLNILNFQADNGYTHESKETALAMVELIGQANSWSVVTTSDTAIINKQDLKNFDVVVFNNNCGTDGPIFSPNQHLALKWYIKNGGGFMGIHCAGAIWHEIGDFQGWYEKLIGTRMVDHPHVQKAKLIVENCDHIATQHLPEEWIVEDEWHRFAYNPRQTVNVLISLDEDSYEGEEKMGGDHPFTWYQYYDGGRSFFTSLGHTISIYENDNYQKLVEGGIRWASGEYDD